MEDVEDVDADADGDGDGDVDGDGEDGENDEDEGDGDNDDEDEQDDAESPSQSQRQRGDLPNGVPSTPGPSRTSTNPTVMLTSPSPRTASVSAGTGLPFRPSV